ncbi:ribonuclease P protein component [Microcella alkaliphila]|uniref:Ribonuclease P protein component n=1 Tax=Microcella alkaliphila TaxID=279828 RepID=A0A4Q7TII8_9MICO|nr:ribonuclease P protein component [Microcella alkaliphila]RZT59667.1 ribonuclease P protein component [Microcella alkaliphila]
MLARAHRVRSGSDFRETMRRGRKTATPTAVVYARSGEETAPARFGIIVSKAVGGAVVRNRIKRRVRAICANVAPSIPAGTAVVIRMLPAAAEVTWDTLREQLTTTIRRAVNA